MPFTTNITQSSPPGKQIDNTISIHVIDELSGLAEHAAAWNALSQLSPPQLPLSSWAWLATFFEFSVKPEQSWYCIFAYENNALVGVLPLVSKPQKIAGFAWSILSTPYDDHTIAVSPLLAPGRENAVLSALLKTAWSLRSDIIRIEMKDIPATSSLLQHAGDQLYLIRSQRGGAYLPVSGEQEVYQSSLSKNFRSNQRKAANKINKMSAVEYEFIGAPHANSGHLSEFMPVESSGWKGRAGTAINSSPHLLTFYTTLTQRLADAGWLEWHFLRAGGKTIAANLAVRFGHSVIVWKLGYHEEFARCSPGGRLFQRLLDHTFHDQDIHEVNMLTEAAWCDNWNMTSREYYTLRFYNRHGLHSLLLGYLPDRLLILLRNNRFIHKLAKKILRSSRKANKQ